MSVSSDNSDRESYGSWNERAGMSDVEGDEEFELTDYEYENSSDVDCCDSIFEEAAYSTSLFNQEPISCPICRDDGVEEGRALTLPDCSHSFCVECFNKYLESQIGNGNADCITCPFILGGEDCEKMVGRQCNSTVELEVLKEIMFISNFLLYRFCYACGSENAQCGCTPAHHGFTDNKTGYGDFSGLTEARSYT